MLRMKLVTCVILVSVIQSGCTSKPSVPKSKPLPPPAWLMQPPPDLLTPLSEIIGYSENELQSQSKWLKGCRIISNKNAWNKKAQHGRLGNTNNILFHMGIVRLIIITKVNIYASLLCLIIYFYLINRRKIKNSPMI